MFPLDRYDETQSALSMSGSKSKIDMCAMQSNAATNRKNPNYLHK